MQTKRNEVFLVLGSNIDKDQNISLALHELKKQFQVIKKSHIYESKAWPNPSEPTFYNLAALVNTQINATDLKIKLRNIEKKLNRVRNKNNKNQARTIDIDIAFYNNAIIHEKALIIPDPEAHLREHLIVPLSEIAPNFIHPKLNEPLINLAQKFKESLSIWKVEKR